MLEGAGILNKTLGGHAGCQGYRCPHHLLDAGRYAVPNVGREGVPQLIRDGLADDFRVCGVPSQRYEVYPYK